MPFAFNRGPYGKAWPPNNDKERRHRSTAMVDEPGATCAARHEMEAVRPAAHRCHDPLLTSFLLRPVSRLLELTIRGDGHFKQAASVALLSTAWSPIPVVTLLWVGHIRNRPDQPPPINQLSVAFQHLQAQLLARGFRSTGACGKCRER